MNFNEWLPFYEKIVRTFGYSVEKDEEAARVLSALLRGRGLGVAVLKERLQGKVVVVLGAGPSLERNLRDLASLGITDDAALIAADGATTAALNLNLTPSVIATDLDGRIEDVIEACRLGSIAVVHAHGDNIDTVKRYVPALKGRVVGSVQVKPLPNVYNFGGFTDGDRGAFIADAVGASAIVLAGMDLGRVVGKYSKPWLKSHVKANRVKAKKLEVAKELLEWLSLRSRAKLFNITGTSSIKGFVNVEASELKPLLASSSRGYSTLYRGGGWMW